MIEEWTEEELALLSRRAQVKKQAKKIEKEKDPRFQLVRTIGYWQKHHAEEYAAYNKKREAELVRQRPPEQKEWSAVTQRHIILECLKKSKHHTFRGRVNKKKVREIIMEIEKQKAERFVEARLGLPAKPIILCIVGLSGSGKTFASLHLKYKCNANVICSFTTRAPRPNEVEGRDHHFVDIWPPKEDMLAYTIFGLDHRKYYALKCQVFGPCTVYVVDEKGLTDLREKWGDEYEIHAIFIMRRRSLRRASGVEEERMNRDLFRKFLPWDSYDRVIRNDSTKASFIKKIEEIYYKLYEKGKQNGF